MAIVLSRGSNPVWLYADLTGHLFDDTFYMFVLENTIPYIPATVWHDASASVEWGFPIQFFANGTLPIDIYWDSSVVYRLEFRKGPTQSDPLIYLVEDYTPGGSGGVTPIVTADTFTGNQISNAQFSVLNFTPPLVLVGATTQELEIAPGWTLSLTGAGSLTLDRLALNSTLANPTNAPYALKITSSGWDADGGVKLKQRFNQNGMLWASTLTTTRYVSSSITARMDGAPQNISAILIDSMGTPICTVLNPTLVNGAFNEFNDSGPVTTPTDTDTPPAAWIEYQLTLPNNATIYISSIQLISTALESTFEYEQDSIERQVDHLFHYYKDPLLYKPISSYLVGWDFPLNPAQVTTPPDATVAAPAAAFAYTWDQTILFQSTISRIATIRSTSRAMTLTNTGGATQLAIIQYLPTQVAKSLLKGKLSVTVQADSTVVGGLVGTVSLWVTTNAAIPVLPLGFFTGLDTNGKPSAGIVADWVEVARNPTLGDAKFTLTSTLQEYGFNGWNSPNTTLPTTTTWFAIVVGTASIPDTKLLSINSVSLVPGDVQTIPAPQTVDEVLRECQYYYRKSFETSTLPVGAAGQYTGEWVSFLADIANRPGAWGPTIKFDYSMRVVPSVTLYNPIINNNQIRNYTTNKDWSLSVATINLTTKGFIASGTVPNIPSEPFDNIAVHWVADARLGVV